VEEGMRLREADLDRHLANGNKEGDIPSSCRLQPAPDRTANRAPPGPHGRQSFSRTGIEERLPVELA
jgi:hypothetical protein